MQDQRITCTTTDPLVACLFGVECRNHGHAVTLMASGAQFGGVIGPPNHFAVIEAEVSLMINPVEFARSAELTLEVDEALRILAAIDFDQVPIRIRDKWALRQAIVDSCEAGHRLNEEQVQQFNTLALRETP